MILILLVIIGGIQGAIVDGTVMLFDGLPNPTSKLCTGGMLEIQQAPNATTGLFTFSRPLETTAMYCLQVLWSGTGLTTLTQINGFMARVHGASGNGGGIQLAMPLKTVGGIMSGSQVGVIFPACSASSGSLEFNQHNFIVDGGGSDGIEGSGVAFYVSC